MLRLKTKMGMRGQLVIPKMIRESLGIVENKTILLEVDNKTVRLIPVESQDILSAWEEIAKKEGGNISKEFVYGDKLYEEVFSK